MSVQDMKKAVETVQSLNRRLDESNRTISLAFSGLEARIKALEERVGGHRVIKLSHSLASMDMRGAGIGGEAAYRYHGSTLTSGLHSLKPTTIATLKGLSALPKKQTARKSIGRSLSPLHGVKGGGVAKQVTVRVQRHTFAKVGNGDKENQSANLDAVGGEKTKESADNAVAISNSPSTPSSDEMGFMTPPII